MFRSCEKCVIRRASVLACGSTPNSDRHLCALCAVREQIEFWTDRGHEHAAVTELLGVEREILAPRVPVAA